MLGKTIVISVLGVKYTVVVKKYGEDATFKRLEAGGYCNSTNSEIVLCDMATYPDWEEETESAIESQTKKLLRHEIVHAFLEESGLSANSNESDAWARNEEMVDWFAIQGPKIYKAWEDAEAL